MFDWEADAGRRTAHAGGQAQLASSINLYIILRLPRNKPIRELNLYLGFTPAERANPILLVMNLRVPYRLVQRGYRLHHRVANHGLLSLYGAIMAAERIALIGSRRSNGKLFNTCCYPSRHSYGIWLSDVPHGLWYRLQRQRSGLLPFSISFHLDIGSHL